MGTIRPGRRSRPRVVLQLIVQKYSVSPGFRQSKVRRLMTGSKRRFKREAGAQFLDLGAARQGPTRETRL
jgi:hypothetical protein